MNIRFIICGFVAICISLISFSQQNRQKVFIVKDFGAAGDGKEWHHIVEQTSSNISEFGAGAVHNTGNLIRLDIHAHRQISAYFSSKQAFTNGRTVREWLSTQSMERQRAFGLDILERFGGE